MADSSQSGVIISGKKNKSQVSIPMINSDTYFKLNMKNLDVARDFLTFNLPEKIKTSIDLETLALAPQEYLTAALRKKSADIVYTVKLKDTEDELGYLVLHIEQQTNPKRLMPLRMLEFMMTMTSQFAEKQLKKDSVPLPIVIPIILSNHSGPYPYSTRFLDLYSGAGQALVASLLNEPLPLVDLASSSDEVLRQHLRATIMEIALKNVKKQGFGHIVMGCVDDLNLLIEAGVIDECGARELIDYLLCYLYDNAENVPEGHELDEILATAQAKVPSKTGEVFMTIREHFEQRGEQRGMQQGMQRIIENMLNKGIPDEQICDYAGISRAELLTFKSLSLGEED